MSIRTLNTIVFLVGDKRVTYLMDDSRPQVRIRTHATTHPHEYLRGLEAFFAIAYEFILRHCFCCLSQKDDVLTNESNPIRKICYVQRKIHISFFYPK